MTKFDEKTGFLTLPHPEHKNRAVKFRIRAGLLETADEDGILWQPRRLATPEEIAMYEAMGNLCVTPPQEGRG